MKGYREDVAQQITQALSNGKELTFMELMRTIQAASYNERNMTVYWMIQQGKLKKSQEKLSLIE